eukprot:5759534-Amphidinium_carterae.1
MDNRSRNKIGRCIDRVPLKQKHYTHNKSLKQLCMCFTSSDAGVLPPKPCTTPVGREARLMKQ